MYTYLSERPETSLGKVMHRGDRNILINLRETKSESLK
jgi:hypothetical protein